MAPDTSGSLEHLDVLVGEWETNVPGVGRRPRAREGDSPTALPMADGPASVALRPESCREPVVAPSASSGASRIGTKG